ncbi:hypothetical protein FRB90_001935 [Tulasnella sp. 427]|nr:hypothetical protein FRB90_001935 [Tulasnella sp. 427]
MAPAASVPVYIPTNPSDSDPTHYITQPTPSHTNVSTKGMGAGIAVSAVIIVLMIIVIWSLEILSYGRNRAQGAEEVPEGNVLPSEYTGALVSKPKRALVIAPKVTMSGYSNAQSPTVQAEHRSRSKLLQKLVLRAFEDTAYPNRPRSAALTVQTCNTLRINDALEGSVKSKETPSGRRVDLITHFEHANHAKSGAGEDKDTLSIVTLEPMTFRPGEEGPLD